MAFAVYVVVVVVVEEIDFDLVVVTIVFKEVITYSAPLALTILVFSTTLVTVVTNDVITVDVVITESLASSAVAVRISPDSFSLNEVFVSVMLSSLLQNLVAVEIF